MKLYYTTTAGQGNEQKNKNASLGGYRSSTQVPNGRLNNLFGDLSAVTIQRNEDQYIGLMLLNDTGALVENVYLWFIYEKTDDESINDCVFEIAAVVPSTDSDGYSYIENIDNIYSAPYSGDFYEADGEVNKVLIGDIANGAMIGLWIKRSIDLDKIESDYDDMITADISGTTYTQTALATLDTVGMKIEWD